MNFEWSYIPWVIGTIIACYFLYKALKRIIKGIISYRKLGKEEFLKRLNEGFEGITPAQRTKGEIHGIIISLIGMITGLIVMSIFRIENVWYWVVISLGGGAVITIFQLIGKIQTYKAQKKQDDLMKEVINQNVIEEISEVIK